MTKLTGNRKFPSREFVDGFVACLTRPMEVEGHGSPGFY